MKSYVLSKKIPLRQKAGGSVLPIKNEELSTKDKGADFRGKNVSDKTKVRRNPDGFHEFLTRYEVIFTEKRALILM